MALPVSDAGADDSVCTIGETGFQSAPFKVGYRFPLKPRSPPPPPGVPDALGTLLLAAPSPLVRPSSVSARPGLAGRVDEVGARLDAAVPAGGGGGGDKDGGSGRTGASKAGSASTEAGAEPRAVTATLTLRWAFDLGASPVIRLEPAGDAAFSRPEDIAPDEVADAAGRMMRQKALLAGWRARPTDAEREALIRGRATAFALPGNAGGSETAKGFAQPFLPSECAGYFRLKVMLARLEESLAASASRAARLQAFIRDERKKRGVLGKLIDSSEIDRAERSLARERRAQREAIRPAIDRVRKALGVREKRLQEDQHGREIAALKADPAKLAAERSRRADALVAAGLSAEKLRYQILRGEAYYAQQLAIFDAIAAQRPRSAISALATGFEGAEGKRERLARARDSWRTAMDRIYAARLKEQERLQQQNIRDGIGPTVKADAYLAATGRSLPALLTDADRARADRSARKRVSSDVITLGGAATEDKALAAFLADIVQTANSPAEIARRIGHANVGILKAGRDFIPGFAEAVHEGTLLAAESIERQVRDLAGASSGPTIYDSKLDDLAAKGVTYLQKTGHRKISADAVKLLQAVDRRLDGLAAQGDRGIYKAIQGAAYGTAAVLGADAVMMQGFVRAGQVVRSRQALRALDAAEALPVPSPEIPDLVAAPRDGGTRSGPVAEGPVQAPDPALPATYRDNPDAATLRDPRVTERMTVDPARDSAAPAAGGGVGDGTGIVPAPFRFDTAHEIDLLPMEGDAGWVLRKLGDGSFREEIAPWAIADDMLVGQRLGGGGNSAVYSNPVDSGTVVKSVGLDPAWGLEDAGLSVRDQQFGYRLLKSLERDLAGDGLVRIAERKGEPRLVRTVADGREAYFALTVEENIARPVVKPDGRLLLDRGHDPVLASNARQRLDLSGRESLNAAEQLTLNLAVRRLNRRGVAWLDQKLENIDIIESPASPTGYQAVFFDFDGMRTIGGPTEAARYRNARDVQRLFDNVTESRQVLPALVELEGRAGDGGLFDLGPAGGEDFGILHSVNANAGRPDFHALNAQDGPTFEQTLRAFNARTGRKVEIGVPLPQAGGSP